MFPGFQFGGRLETLGGRSVNLWWKGTRENEEKKHKIKKILPIISKREE